MGTAVGGSTTLTGTLQDQWSQPFTPAGGTQATLNVDQNNTTYGSADYSHIVDISNGTFSFSYPDVTSNSSARTDAYRWTVGAVNSRRHGHGQVADVHHPRIGGSDEPDEQRRSARGQHPPG